MARALNLLRVAGVELQFAQGAINFDELYADDAAASIKNEAFD